MTLILLFLFVLLSLSITTKSFALTADTAVSVPLPVDIGNPGDIVSFYNSDYQLSSVEYDQSIVGVIVNDPVSSYEDQNLDTYKLVVDSGEVFLIPAYRSPIKGLGTAGVYELQAFKSKNEFSPSIKLMIFILKAKSVWCKHKMNLKIKVVSLNKID